MESATGAAPERVLFVTTCWWPSFARLAHLFHKAGCTVSMLCPPGHPARSIPSITLYQQRAFRPLSALSRAMAESRADIIIAGDDRAVGYLHRLHGLGSEGERRVIKRSLGDPAHYAITASRIRLSEQARRHGMAVPADAALHDGNELQAWAATIPFPWVIKRDGAWSGMGVKIVHSIEEAREAFRDLSRGVRLHIALKRLLINRDPFWIADAGTGAPSVSVQAYVHGRPGNLALFCDRGEILAATCVDVVACWGETGPSTIVRLKERGAFLDSAAGLIRQLGLSGFAGIDYILDEATGEPVMIEMNPRATSLANIRSDTSHDLIGAAIAAWWGRRVAPAPPIGGELIAHFPLCQHWNSEDPRLPSCHQDIPSDLPALVAAMLAPSWPDRHWAARLFAWLKRSAGGSAGEWEIRLAGAPLAAEPRAVLAAGNPG